MSWSSAWRRSILGATTTLVFGASAPAQSTAAPIGDGKPAISVGSARRLDKSEAGAVEQMAASELQKDAFDRLLKERADKTKAFLARRPHDPAEGVEINKWWNGELKKLFTAEQYAKYVAYWNAGTRSPVAVAGLAAPRKAKLALTRSPDFHAMEQEILGKLGLSDAQKEDVAKIQTRLAKDDEVFRVLSRTSDHAAAMKKGQEINAGLRAAMQRVMTKEQYARYLELWDAKLGVKGGAVKVAAPAAGS